MTTLEARSMQLALSIQFRLAEKEDIPKLEWYGQFIHYQLVFRRTFREQTNGRRLMIVADCQDFPIGQIFVQLYGSARVGENPRNAYLYSLRVMEMFRGQGIGTRLVKEAERMVIERGFETATIAVAKDNPRAKVLYERLGYQVFREENSSWSYIDHQGRTRHVYEPCYLLEKTLTTGS